MDIQRFEVGPFQENTYLISLNDESILIDPGFHSESEFNVFRKELQSKGTELIAVLLTHAHVDHVLGLSRVKSEFDVPVYLCHKDLFLWENFAQQSMMFGFSQPAFGFKPDPLPVDEQMEIGDFGFECLYTPGHSPDHISFYFEEYDALISGDALFKSSIGRTDLYKGDLHTLEESIRKKLYVLPDQTKVYPGHGLPTEIGFEKHHNPFVKNL